MCAHSQSARRTRTVIIRGYVVHAEYCPQCKVEQQRVRRARLRGRLFSINESLVQFARLPVIT
jgi:hypothetical protein